MQGTASLLPASHRINEVLQHLNGSLTLTRERAMEKYQMALRHQAAAERHGVPIAGSHVLEIGTGWHPIVPVALALRGAARVTTADIRPMLSVERTLDVIKRLREFDPVEQKTWSGAARMKLESIPDDYDGPVKSLLALLGVESRVGLASDPGVVPSDVQVIVSNNTLEHVPADQLESMMDALRSQSAFGVIASHYIDLTDHYAHFDRSIDVYHFLRYSDRMWRPFNNRLHYQNRLRAPEYRRIIERHGWRIVEEDARRASTEPPAHVAPRFAGTDPAELTISELHLVAKAA